MRVGWARPNVRADTELGGDELAYVFNGFKAGPKSCFVLVKNPIKSAIQKKELKCFLFFFFSGPTMAYGYGVLWATVAVW